MGNKGLYLNMRYKAIFPRSAWVKYCSSCLIYAGKGSTYHCTLNMDQRPSCILWTPCYQDNTGKKTPTLKNLLAPNGLLYLRPLNFFLYIIIKITKIIIETWFFTILSRKSCNFYAKNRTKLSLKLRISQCCSFRTF